MSNHELIQSTPARAKIKRIADYLVTYAIYGLLTMACLAVLGIVARFLFFGLQFGWHLASKFFPF